MMKKVCLVLFVLWTGLWAGWAEDITVDEILALNYETAGGLENLRALKTMHISGKVKMTAQNLEIPIEMWFKDPKMVRMESTFQGMKMLQVYDGETAWQINPLMGSTKPQKMPEDQAREIIDQAEGLNPLVDYKKKGHTITYEGKEDLEGTEVYKLKFTHKNGEVTYYFLDMETGIELKTLTYRKQNEKENKIETFLGDYKKFDDLVFPTSMDIRVNGQPQTVILFEKITVNPEISDETFAFPQEK